DPGRMTLAATIGILALAAAVQAVSGFGFALTAVPLLTLAVGPRTAVVTVLLVGLVLSVGVALRERGHVRRRDAIAVGVAGLVGMPLGLLLLTTTSERVLTTVIAVVLLASVVLIGRGIRLPRGLRTEVGAGLLSGALLTSTSMNGPPRVVAFQAQGLPARERRATLATVFVVHGATAVALVTASGQVTEGVATLAVAGIPALAVGWLAGDRLFRRLEPVGFRRVVLAMLTVTALVALAGALWG
ncbi:MAG TPA: sulfite exporter TauE/SafE family protein, partial [Jiangellales bacterium]|nr:sulfite exporter TauE/SafE family protein [Jiangellales bacterium]